MDGAGKFVKGDAIAALVIVALNLAGGVVGGRGVSWALAGRRGLDVRTALDRQRAGHDAPCLPDLDRDGHDGHARRLRRCARRRFGGATLRASRCAAQCRHAAAGTRARSRAAAPALHRAGWQRFRHGGARAAKSRGDPRARRSRRASAANATRCGGRSWRWGSSVSTPCRVEIGADLALLLTPPLSDALLDRIGEVRRALAADIGVVLPGVRLARRPRARSAHLRHPRARPMAGDGRLELERLLAVADEAVLGAFRSADRTRARLRVARGVDSRPTFARARSTRARSSSIRSRCSARTSRRSRARTPPSSLADKSCKRCSNTCKTTGARAGEGDRRRRAAVRRAAPRD